MWLLLVSCAAFFCGIAESANILGIFITPSYSHQIVFQPIWKELSLRGHKVTVYTPFPLNDSSLTNLTEYDLGLSSQVFKASTTEAGRDYAHWFELYRKTSEAQLNYPDIQNLIANKNDEKFDLLLVEYMWPPYYALKEIYQVPMVGITSLQLTFAATKALGMSKHPVLEPNFLLGISSADTFIKRLKSWLFDIIMTITPLLKTQPVFDNQIETYFPQVKKTASQLSKEVSLVLGNYNLGIHKAKPFTQNFIPISGLHIQETKKLPQDLKKVLDAEPKGVIYFSLGTNVNPSQISQEQIYKIFNALGQLPYTVFFKGNLSTMSNIPNNIYDRKWFPQQDILAHEKVKLFITQGGIQSIDEAIYRKVPMLIIPLIADQYYNADMCVQLGIAEKIEFDLFTEKELKEKLHKLLTDKTYNKNLHKQYDIMTDKPMGPLETAIFWIEYVIRHKGATHLRYAGADLPFYQHDLLDIYSFLIFTCIVIYYSVKKLNNIYLNKKQKIANKVKKP